MRNLDLETRIRYWITLANFYSIQWTWEFSLQAVRDKDEILARKRRAQPLELIPNPD